MRRRLRFLRQAAVLKWTVLQAFVDFARRPYRSDVERADWMHYWCATCLRRLGIRYSVSGVPPVAGLVVSNHLSYLDIMVFGAVMRCVFVSRVEVKSWPVFGWLTTMAGTVYVDRKRRSDTRNANEGISRALQQGLPVVVFPEGASSAGAEVLPFYPSLFEPAVESNSGVTAAYLSYEVEDGNVAQDVAYWGTMTFFPHLLRLLSLREIRATIRFADAPRVFEDRKLAAQETRLQVMRLGALTDSVAASSR
jgi:1-acyl-sn-glycerol-3-phosphate acyltransferase